MLFGMYQQWHVTWKHVTHVYVKMSLYYDDNHIYSTLKLDW